jgi:hypothetical protein
MPDSSAVIAENIARIGERIARAAESAGRSVDDVSLMAVTKFHPLEAVRYAYLSGIRFFGENRVQEALAKYPPIRVSIKDASLHMIGTLQKNKINKALAIFDAIEGIDSVDTLRAVLTRIDGRKEPFRLYLELHTGEASKAGFPNLDELLRGCEAYAEFLEGDVDIKSARLCGLMTMAPFTQDSSEIRKSFKMLAAAKKEVEKRFHFSNFGELSMGMSNDFEIAIEEGATLVRIGTAIFGERDVHNA